MVYANPVVPAIRPDTGYASSGLADAKRRTRSPTSSSSKNSDDNLAYARFKRASSENNLAGAVRSCTAVEDHTVEGTSEEPALPFLDRRAAGLALARVLNLRDNCVVLGIAEAA